MNDFLWKLVFFLMAHTYGLYVYSEKKETDPDPSKNPSPKCASCRAQIFFLKTFLVLGRKEMSSGFVSALEEMVEGGWVCVCVFWEEGTNGKSHEEPSFLFPAVFGIDKCSC